MGNKTALPPNWTVETIGDLGRVITGKTPSTKDPGNFGGTIPFITPSDMDGRKRISRTARFLTDRGATSVSSANIPAGAVMVSCIGSDMGKASIAGCDAVTNQQINSIIVKDVVSADYVYYNLSTRQTEIKHIGSGGSAVPILNKGHFSQLQITLPPLPEQKAIAHILGTLDDKIEVNRRMNETLEGMARALFKSWFVDFDPVLDNALAAGNPIPEEYRDRAAQRADAATSAASQGRPFGLPNPLAAQFPNAFHDSDLGPIPQGWEVSTVGDIAEINNWTLGKRDALDIIDYIEISEVMRGDIGKISRYARGEEPSRARRRLKHGDTVLSTVRPDRGAYFLALQPRETLIASTGFAVLTPKDGNWAFLNAATTQPEFGEELGRLADGGAYPAIRPDVVGNRELVIPGGGQLATAFDELIQPLFWRSHQNRKESRTLAALRDTLLPKLLSGELRVNDAEKSVEGVV